MAETVPGIGRLVAGRYRLAGEVGRGGMGVVWQADDTLIGRQVAVKGLRAPAGLPATGREAYAARALAEARNAARVRHPGVVTLHDVIPATGDDDAVYLVMELVRAPTLAGVVASRGPLPAAQVARIGVELLDVLDAAHALGVVHRDVKPANIMLEPGAGAAPGRARLADFVIAHTAGDPRLTGSGILGTQAYLAPELFEGAPITPAADLWSLGATLHHAVSGTGPFDRATTTTTTTTALRAILIEDLPAPACGPPLCTAISAALTRDPARRGASQQLRPLLQQAAAGGAAELPAPATRKNRWPIALAVVLVIALAVAVPLYLTRPRSRVIATLKGPAALVQEVAYRPGGRSVAAAAGSRIYLWDVATHKLTATLVAPGDNSLVQNFAFSPDGATLAAADYGSSAAYLWNVATGRLMATLSSPFGDGADGVAFGPGGATLAVSGGEAGLVTLWNVTGIGQ